MIVHTLFTDGRFGWACIFLASYKRHHGESDHIHMCGRDLTTPHINRLKSLYSNLTIDNRQVDLEMVAKRANVDVGTIKKWRYQVEHGSPVRGQSDIWKKYISVEDRYRNSLVEIMNLYPKETILHCDIDTYFRAPVTPLKNLIKDKDISIRFRLNEANPGRRVLACMMGLNNTPATMNFMNRWIEMMDEVSLPNKSKNERFSQFTFYKTYLELKDTVKWGNIPATYADPERRAAYVVWTGCKKAKDEGLKDCVADFRKENK